jgi:ketosteroid isomerase-like protein
MEDVVITAAGDRVVVEGRNRNTARATGRPYEHSFAHSHAGLAWHQPPPGERPATM